MPAYVVFVREGPVVDAEAMSQYQTRNRAVPPPGMKPLVVYGPTETIEGEPCEGMVILEFEDVESARKWYFSEEYQEAAALRQQGAPYRGFIVEGWKP
jgi:uncharacterized protein (DUF1330 family)